MTRCSTAPVTLGCESLPEPYEQYGSTPSDYGNHDLANPPQDGLSIDYIVIHDTEGCYDTALKLVDDPTYLAWHYTVRSSDGHVAQHTNPKNVGFHAGNWYVNIHSIGIEHEGFAATGATWYTESTYQSSATLVKYLSAKYGVPLDRARAVAVQMFDVVKRQDGWTAVWWLGELAWFKDVNAAGKPVARPSKGTVVQAKGTTEVPVYGRAYPEQAAYAGVRAADVRLSKG